VKIVFSFQIKAKNKCKISIILNNTFRSFKLFRSLEISKNSKPKSWQAIK